MNKLLHFFFNFVSTRSFITSSSPSTFHIKFAFAPSSSNRKSHHRDIPLLSLVSTPPLNSHKKSKFASYPILFFLFHTQDKVVWSQRRSTRIIVICKAEFFHQESSTAKVEDQGQLFRTEVNRRTHSCDFLFLWQKLKRAKNRAVGAVFLFHFIFMSHFSSPNQNLASLQEWRVQLFKTQDGTRDTHYYLLLIFTFCNHNYWSVWN